VIVRLLAAPVHAAWGFDDVQALRRVSSGLVAGGWRLATGDWRLATEYSEPGVPVGLVALIAAARSERQ
jgi:hypothetical protein